MTRRGCFLVAGLWLWTACATLPAQEPVAEIAVVADQDKKTDSAEKKDDKKKDDKDKKPAQEEAKDESIFAKMPPIARFPTVGIPLFFPTGSGFYSLKEHVLGEWSEKPPKYPYPRFGFIQPSFFDMDWRYLDKPDNKEHDYFDCLKRIHLCDDCFLFSTGGDIRYRYASETNSRLTTIHNTYDLTRARVYADLCYKDRLRVFAEFIDAQSFGAELAPLPIDVNRSDMLNLFAEVRTLDICGEPVWVRTGRQELLYGSQRSISTLDWANTRRTFQGVKAYRHGEHLDIDAFCVQPVIPDPSEFDSVDNNQVFTGLWATWKPDKKQAIDFYYLNLDNTNTTVTLGIPTGQFNIHTLGSRYFGKSDCGWRADVEGAVQLGSKRDEPVCAYMVAAGIGYEAKDCPGTPQLWLYYDHASGDNSPDARNHANTFNQLFPFGHYYFGYIDVVARQNIHDFNAQFAVFPTKWLTTFAQFHVFQLDKPRDALYNAAGVPIRRDPTGRAGTDVGQELDLVLNVHLSKHAQIYLSYSHLFTGSFIERTGNGRDPDYLYLQYSYRW